ncbi:MAG: addiction module toxin RelE [Bacteroidetes bacterium HGW-Bacteroidetes-21]|jgi:phage-related protein|nr:MAG: addiction module toxin RelE [Bacteroidetes bacterium HGW-Bacteroidetes-21]
MKREVFFYKDYFRKFFQEQDLKTRMKILRILDLIQVLDRIPEKYFKHLTGTNELYEIRIQLGSNNYRIICFFDKGNLVVLLNSFKKKTQKTPKNEIQQAEKLKQQYYEEKR